MVCKMSKSDMQILVVEKNALFGSNGEYFFEGFRPHHELDYESRILANLESMRRGSVDEDANHPEGNAERNSGYKQPIGYMLIVNPNTKKVFAYQRSSDNEKYMEKRLQGKWSWGVGGHIEAQDTKGNPIQESTLRELKEEVEFKGEILGEPKVLGYIYHDFDVHKVHFGILYLIETNEEVEPRDPEISHGKFMDLNELEKICFSNNCEVEEWSKTAIKPLKDYFQ